MNESIWLIGRAQGDIGRYEYILPLAFFDTEEEADRVMPLIAKINGPGNPELTKVEVPRLRLPHWGNVNPDAGRKRTPEKRYDVLDANGEILASYDDRRTAEARRGIGGNQVGRTIRDNEADLGRYEVWAATARLRIASSASYAHAAALAREKGATVRVRDTLTGETLDPVTGTSGRRIPPTRSKPVTRPWRYDVLDANGDVMDSFRTRGDAKACQEKSGVLASIRDNWRFRVVTPHGSTVAAFSDPNDALNAATRGPQGQKVIDDFTGATVSQGMTVHDNQDRENLNPVEIDETSEPEPLGRFIVRDSVGDILDRFAESTDAVAFADKKKNRRVIDSETGRLIFVRNGPKPEPDAIAHFSVVDPKGFPVATFTDLREALKEADRTQGHTVHDDKSGFIL